MTKRKRSDIEAELSKLQAELADAADDDDAEIWVKRGDAEVKLTGSDKAGFLARFFGDMFDGDGDGDGGQDGDGDGAGDGAGGQDGGQDGGQAPKPRRSYWGSRT